MQSIYRFVRYVKVQSWGETKREKEKIDCTVHGGDAADCVVLEIAVTFDKRVVVFVIDGDVVGDGYAGAKVAARVPVPWRPDLPSREDGVQSFRCCLLQNNCQFI
ncbi:hypothetical protein IGI04_007440 [Brassica rapa subsp. trilocularis]|uniref:Uncharacterized protein n=1 Tax=Brassica rapa subsp. trilocularis TaxID=1813537 RepID=A0ABQ7NJQ9_BRACM|nr:hypothetical protein IGI04_007440 [Brassica rapa subsp. trilocularis]